MNLGDLARKLYPFLAPLFLATGTFTPTITGTGTAGTFTYVTGRRDGRYTCIGDRVDFALEVAISAIAVAPTGDIQITGLPFMAAGDQDGSVSFSFISNLNTSANIVQLTGLVQSTTSAVALYEMFDNAASTAYPAANFTNVNAQLRLTGTYWIG